MPPLDLKVSILGWFITFWLIMI